MNCYQLLEYLASNVSSDGIMCSTYGLEEKLKISKEYLNDLLQELSDLGYIQVFIRSVKITPDGFDYLK